MAMLLTGDNGTEFELGLIEDPLEDTQDGGDDSVALTISFRVATQDDSWEETAPCLNTFELNNLVEWMEGVVGGRGDVAEVELLEPDLKFSIVDRTAEHVTMRINFHLEDRPEEFGMDASTDADHIDLKLEREQIRVAIAELKRDLTELRLTTNATAAGDESIDDVESPEEDLNIMDGIEEEPEGMGDGEDNAGER